MRRITLWALSTLTTLVLLFSYHTSTSSKASTIAAPVVAQAPASGSGSASGDGSSATPSPTPSTGSASSGSSSSGSSSSGSSSSGSSPSGSSSKATTYDGDAVSTRYGDVQVQITVKSGKVAAVQVIQVPWNDQRDQEINSYAVPILNSEAVAAQSANIDMVSGATFTSDGYIQSLQSAIDRAHL
ncbi:FMN-binding protein [Pedococcus sp. 5OH_020]|uniref:FMN-binding protein n=1 Tax=Pedococcus sp. 5OH_020 TaxID=2989814 RepID=UPI0022E9BCE2|nr:FMN-binding protein [Pedococcus sp. 5OH_020]